jgi:hypothetical protein
VIECIYLLRDSATEKVRYVGRSRDPFRRLLLHIASAFRGSRTPIHNWIADEMVSGHPPILEVVEFTEEGRVAEKRWITKLSDEGSSLLNVRCNPKIKEARYRPMGIKASPETRAKMSVSATRRWAASRG